MTDREQTDGGETGGDELKLGYRDRLADKEYERLVAAKTDIAHGWLVVIPTALLAGGCVEAGWDVLAGIILAVGGLIGVPKLISGYVDHYRFRRDT